MWPPVYAARFIALFVYCRVARDVDGGAVTASFLPTVMYSSSFADVELWATSATFQPLIPSPKVAEDWYLIEVTSRPLALRVLY